MVMPVGEDKRAVAADFPAEPKSGGAIDGAALSVAVKEAADETVAEGRGDALADGERVSEAETLALRLVSALRLVLVVSVRRKRPV